MKQIQSITSVVHEVSSDQPLKHVVWPAGYNICRNKPRGGFSFPSYTAWLFALGPHQLKV